MNEPISPEDRPTFSVVLPVYNEEGNIAALYQRLQAVFASMNQSYELVFVDDGSRDQSFAKLHEIQRQDPHVQIVKFSRNFGHHLAVTAGLDHTRGEYIVLMDSDLQDQPEEIPKLYAKMQEGFDVVYGLRKHSQFSWLKRTLSSGFRWVMRRLIGYPIEGGIYRILTRQVVEQVRQCREIDRIVIGLIHWVGFRQTGVEVEHAPRVAGETKYTLSKQMQLAKNAITAFSTQPLKIASGLGALVCAASGLVALCLVGSLLFLRAPFTGWPTLLLLIAILLIGGLQLIALGILGEYLARIFHQTRERPLYIVESYLHSPLPLPPPSPSLLDSQTPKPGYPSLETPNPKPGYPSLETPSPEPGYPPLETPSQKGTNLE